MTFLKDHFERKWKYINDKKNDQHLFWLVDPVLGKYNKL
jgi:pyridoxal/pyridoxine/pyridoxamine kinase